MAPEAVRLTGKSGPLAGQTPIVPQHTQENRQGQPVRERKGPAFGKNTTAQRTTVLERDDLKPTRLQIIPLYFNGLEHDSDVRPIRPHAIVL